MVGLLHVLPQLLIAQEAAAEEGGGGGLVPLISLGLMFAVLYFMMIRPQTKQAKDHQQFLSTLQKGQEVSTSGGLVGKVHAVGADTVVVEIAKDVRVTVVRSHVYAWKAPAAPDKAAPSEKSAAEPKPAEAKK